MTLGIVGIAPVEPVWAQARPKMDSSGHTGQRVVAGNRPRIDTATGMRSEN